MNEVQKQIAAVLAQLGTPMSDPENATPATTTPPTPGASSPE
jgi:hypothetical protein